MADFPSITEHPWEYLVGTVAGMATAAGGLITHLSKRYGRSSNPSLERRVSALEGKVDTLQFQQEDIHDTLTKHGATLRTASDNIIRLQEQSSADHERVQLQLDAVLRELRQAIRRAD